MTIDASVAGRSYPPSAPYEVGREKVREFAGVLGETHPAYYEAAAAQALGHADVIAPPTFASILTLISWRQVMADLGVDFAQVLHIDQRFVVVRPLHVGDVVTSVAVVDEVRERMGASWLVIRTDIRTVPKSSDGAGEDVCTAYSTIMVRGEAA